MRTHVYGHSKCPDVGLLCVSHLRFFWLEKFHRHPRKWPSDRTCRRLLYMLRGTNHPRQSKIADLRHPSCRDENIILKAGLNMIEFPVCSVIKYPLISCPNAQRPSSGGNRDLVQSQAPLASVQHYITGVVKNSPNLLKERRPSGDDWPRTERRFRSPSILIWESGLWNRPYDNPWTRQHSDA